MGTGVGVGVLPEGDILFVKQGGVGMERGEGGKIENKNNSWILKSHSKEKNQ